MSILAAPGKFTGVCASPSHFSGNECIRSYVKKGQSSTPLCKEPWRNHKLGTVTCAVPFTFAEQCGTDPKLSCDTLKQMVQEGSVIFPIVEECELPKQMEILCSSLRKNSPKQIDSCSWKPQFMAPEGEAIVFAKETILNDLECCEWGQCTEGDVKFYLKITTCFPRAFKALLDVVGERVTVGELINSAVWRNYLSLCDRNARTIACIVSKSFGLEIETKEDTLLPRKSSLHCRRRIASRGVFQIETTVISCGNTSGPENAYMLCNGVIPECNIPVLEERNKGPRKQFLVSGGKYCPGTIVETDVPNIRNYHKHLDTFANGVDGGCEVRPPTNMVPCVVEVPHYKKEPKGDDTRKPNVVHMFPNGQRETCRIKYHKAVSFSGALSSEALDKTLEGTSWFTSKKNTTPLKAVMCFLPPVQ